MKLTIGKKIGFGFAGTVGLTLALGIFCAAQLHSIHEDSSEVAESVPGLRLAKDMQQLARQNYSLLLEHVVATDNQSMDKIEANMGQVAGKMSDALKTYEAQIDNEKERVMFNAAATARADWLKSREAVMPLSRALKTEEAMKVVQNQVMPAIDIYMNKLQDVATYNEDATRTATTEINDSSALATRVSLIGLGIAVVVGAALAIIIIRGVSKALTRLANTLASGAEQTTSAASQVSSASQSLAQGASEQAASLEETSSSLEEMSSMTKKNAETAQQAAAFSAEAKTAADKGNRAMDKMSSAIGDIQKSASETAKIIKTIDEIAFQTNLLALNAAVEAARAGEAGKGFAVVAEEVRNLAMRSAEAAKTTSSLIEGSVSNANNGVTIVQEMDQTLSEITSASEKVNGLIAEIAAASNEQAQGIGQVNTAVTQIDKVTQANAAAAEESAAASEELSSQAEQLSGVVSELMALVGGSAGGHRVEPSPASSSLAPAKAIAAPREPHAIHAPSHESRIAAAFRIEPASRTA